MFNMIIEELGGRKNTNYIILAVIILVAIIGIFITQPDQAVDFIKWAIAFLTAGTIGTNAAISYEDSNRS